MQIQKHRGCTSQYHLFLRTLNPLFLFFKVWWKFLPWCWEALGSDCFCFRLRAVLYEKSVSLMCFDLLSVTCLTPTCGCLHLSDQKRSYIWMGVVEISTHSGGSQQEALNTKIFSSTQQRPLGSTHIASLPALVSSRSANNTLFFPNKSSRVQKKLGFWQKFAFVSLPVKEQRKFGSMGGYFLSGLKCWRYGFSRTCRLETAAELAPCFWCCPSCQKLNFTYSFSRLQCLLSLSRSHTLSLTHAQTATVPEYKEITKTRHHHLYTLHPWDSKVMGDINLTLFYLKFNIFKAQFQC